MVPINGSCHGLQEKNFAIIELNRLAVTKTHAGITNYFSKSGFFERIEIVVICTFLMTILFKLSLENISIKVKKKNPWCLKVVL